MGGDETTTTSAPGTVRSGGRTGQVRAAVLEAALRELTDHGYAALTVDKIAKRSGVHKTTIYRRWQTKEEVLADAVGDIVERLFPIQATGDIAADLRHAARSLVDVLTSQSPLLAGVVQALFSEASAYPAIAQIKHDFFERRYLEAGSMVAAAIRSGDIPADTDPRELVGQVLSPVYYRFLVTGEPIDHMVADRSVDTALAALRAGACRNLRSGTAQ